MITDVIILRRDAVLAALQQPSNARTMLCSLPFYAGSLLGPYAPAVVRQTADHRRDDTILSSAGLSSSRGRSSQPASRRTVEPRSRFARQPFEQECTWSPAPKFGTSGCKGGYGCSDHAGNA